MPCLKCGYDPCRCKPNFGLKRTKSEEDIQQNSSPTPVNKMSLQYILNPVSVSTFSGSSNFNTFDTPTYGRTFRIMSWNIERLGDTGNLGKHNGERPQDIIEAIAKIIFKADPHICALIEVFTGAKGRQEVGRIFNALTNLCRGTQAVWNFEFSPGVGTGGLSDKDGNNRRDCEGYALFWRSDLGIHCPSAKWLNIYGPQELFTESGKGRSYVRDACEFSVQINGKKLFGSKGLDLAFPIAVFHAPGPRDDPQRQFTIKNAITRLFEVYASPEGERNIYPNAFICADFNASENADNFFEDEDLEEIEYSFPGDLDYMARLITLVTKVELIKKWLELNQGIENMQWPKEIFDFVDKYIKTEYFREMISEVRMGALTFLEGEVEEVENWFAQNAKIFKLTGIREANANAKKVITGIIEESFKQGIRNEEFKAEKERFKLWKQAMNAKNQQKFSEAYWKLDEIEGEEFLIHYVDEDEPITSWQDIQKLVCEAFEDEFEDQQKFLGSQNVKTYSEKIVDATMQSISFYIKNQKKLTIQESYETAFSSGVDTGFFESTSYDETLKTTRRKSILLTGFASGKKGDKWTAVKNANPDSVLYSNYDQVLSRTDEIRIDEPSIKTIPILDCVLGQSWKQTFTSIYLGCAFQELKIPSPHRFFIKVCASANEEYKVELKRFLKKPEYNEKNQTAFKVFQKYKANTPFCCLKQCAKIEDINFLHILQTYLTRAHSVSDHEPVVMTALFKPYPGFDEWYI